MSGFSRFFKKYEWYIVSSAVIISWLLGFIGFVQYFHLHETQVSIADTIYITIQLYTLESGFVDPPMPLILDIARFMAPFSLAMAAIMTILWFARNQFKIYRLSHIKKHIVLFGTDLTGSYLIRNIINSGKKVVVIGNRKDLSEEDLQNENIFFIEGKADDIELHKKARIEFSEKTFYAAQDNNINISAALLSAQYIENCISKTQVNGYTHISSLSTIEKLQNLDYFQKSIIDRNKASRLDIQFFNIYERAARIIMRDYSPDSYFDLHSPDSEAANIFIAGLSHLGKSLILQLARMCHFGNLKKVRVIVWDKDVNILKEFLSEYPELDKILEIKYISDISADHNGLLIDKVQELPKMIYLCSDDNTVSLNILSSLETYYISMKCNVVICHQQESDFLNNYKGKNIFHFNLKEETLTLDSIAKSEIDLLARVIHNDYLNEERKKKTHDPQMASHQEWENLNEPDRNQNRNQADHIWIKLRAIDPEYKTGSNNAPDFKNLENTETIEKLSEMEHLRWMAHKQLNGFKFGKVRDNDKKLHPNIIPYEELIEEDKQKDRDTIVNIPVLYQSLQKT